ncbi:hypothetical protein TrispH2_007297, partial [Trichoplax sp. H2]
KVYNEWSNENRLSRAMNLGQLTLKRAQERKIDWTKKSTNSYNPVEEPVIYTNIEDAFASVMHFMTMTSRQCRRYFSSNKLTSDYDSSHCCKFHKPKYTEKLRRNPLQTDENVRVDVPPGTYAVTAGRWGGEKDHTHVVHVEPGQSVDLTFAV